MEEGGGDEWDEGTGGWRKGSRVAVSHGHMTVEDDNHCGSYCLLSAGQKKICRRDQIRNTSGQQNKDHR
uniref:Bm1367 n=1 Tax=Brugia malayi TaxID=6279 RepID=A0A0H5S7I6_BRUMA|nr:Bm1367 [Brugia malayi]